MSFAVIRRLGIVNRGEAAMRCLRTVKALRRAEGSDLEAVAFYTDVDRDAPFVRKADRAVRLESRNGAVAAYLDRGVLLETLVRESIDAVWPGWGFLAEDPKFVEGLDAVGIRFLGPGADAMRKLGDKITAKTIAERAGVPVTPWSGGALSDVDEALEAAKRVGFPIVLKASAGGGGRGIRILERPEDLPEAFRSARAEAKRAFGDDRLFLEAKVERGRHMEVQILADGHRHVLALGTRDCSVQRRHQKVVEETPPGGVAAELVEELQSSAVRLAREVGYVGAGTVEFLVAGERASFLEMNPRLQVEHGITEAVTGLDLVELQIRVARGESLEGLEVRHAGAAIEARVCAEDPDAGFLPAPGRVTVFDPALGPGIRIDSGVTTGSVIPPDFDSLIAKVMAWGRNREEARTRLAAALDGLELVVEGGASNRGFLLEILEHPAFRQGGVDTQWLDRMERASGELAAEALAAAAVLTYERERHAALLNFYADTSNLNLDRVPASRGRTIELSRGSETYEVRVFAMGRQRYRLHLDDRVSEVRLEEERPSVARLEIGERRRRVLYDANDTGLRLEVDGRVHRFGLQAAGQIRAGTPAMVVAVDVKVGDTVEAGQPLGLLEAMKMEIAFHAPFAARVARVLVARGQQVAAGDVLLVLERGAASEGEADERRARLRLPDVEDPLAPFFGTGGVPDFEHAARTPARARHRAFRAIRDEVRRVLLGYDTNPERSEALAALLESPLPDRLPVLFLGRLARIREELAVFTDVEELFVKVPRLSVSGEGGPSNHARLAMVVRRLRAGGAGVDEAFLDLVRRALARYGIPSLEHSLRLERAMLRLLATQRTKDLRERLVLAILRRLVSLAQAGFPVGRDRRLLPILDRLGALRGLVSDTVADTAIEATHELFVRPRLDDEARRTSEALEASLSRAESDAGSLSGAALRECASSAREIFDRVGTWITDDNPARRSVARRVQLLRLYPEGELREDRGEVGILEQPDGSVVLAATGTTNQALERLDRVAADLSVPVRAFEIFATSPPDPPRRAVGRAERVTLTHLREGETHLHQTFVTEGTDLRELPLHGLHPETARRAGFHRLRDFGLERLSNADGVVVFRGTHRLTAGDARLFVLAEVHDAGPGALGSFERVFHEATRALRRAILLEDPDRRLLWNRIMMTVLPPLALTEVDVAAIAERLAPSTRHLGLEKVLVRLSLRDPADPSRPARHVEIALGDPTGSHLEIEWREPVDEPLEPRNDYERRVVAARRRGLVYPYEILRLLTTSEESIGLPRGTFEEYDLAPDASTPEAVSVSARPWGSNTASVVFGVLSTPTEKVPEGMRRVVILSDPTMDMGALAGPECDRIVAAIDLAGKLSLPVEWVPVSAGARIAMDSGTENLDATARVVRRIVTFTQGGGFIHVIVQAVNVGAQSYFDALATMLLHTRGLLIMTPRGSMVLTGRAALEASGSVAAEDEVGIGGFERIMGPNGEGQILAHDLVDAYRILYEHYRFTYVVPGEAGPRRQATEDPAERSVLDDPLGGDGDLATVGDVFSEETNPGRRKPFPMRALLGAVIDRDGGHLERWGAMAGAETAIVWDAHLGGHPVCLVGIESRNVLRQGYRPLDGPDAWTGGTLFPLSSKKLARALNTASGNRPVVILANLSGFDGSPESMRKLQLEYGAEIARAVVNFQGPIVFFVVSRYHGGAYVVFSQELNEGLRAAAVEGSYASVIGGGPAAAVVFPREVRKRTLADPRVAALRSGASGEPESAARGELERTFREVYLEKQNELAREFDRIHSVERARQVGSLREIVPARDIRAWLIRVLEG